MKRFVMEFIGTFFLVLAISLTNNPLAFGLVFMTMVYVGGHISGSHFNPAVTLAIRMCMPMRLQQVMGYVVSQILGGTAAGLVYYLLTQSVFSPDAGMGIAGWKMFLLEVLFTFVLCIAVLSVTLAQALKNHPIYGVIVGFALLGIAFMGGVYNPAVAVGPMIMDSVVNGSSLFNLLIYIFGPITGGAVAAYTYQYLNK